MDLLRRMDQDTEYHKVFNQRNWLQNHLVDVAPCPGPRVEQHLDPEVIQELLSEADRGQQLVANQRLNLEVDLSPECQVQEVNDKS